MEHGGAVAHDIDIEAAVPMAPRVTLNVLVQSGGRSADGYPDRAVVRRASERP
jgi:hypothetical protein